MKEFNLNSLKIFLAVATSNSFLEASNKLYISQPAISKSINKLEEDLGVTLFYRANKGITLTQDGEVLLRYVKDSRKLLLACERMFSSNNSLDSGIITIGVQSFIVHNYLLGKINDFRKKFPNVTFKILDLSSIELIESLEKHELDFVLDISPIETSYGNLRIERIHELDTYFIKSKNNKKNYKKLIDLDGECLIMQNSNSTLYKNLLNYIENRIDVRAKIEFDDDSLILEAVIQNNGIGYIAGEKLSPRISEKIEIINLNNDLPKAVINLILIESQLTLPAKEFIMNEFNINNFKTMNDEI